MHLHFKSAHQAYLELLKIFLNINGQEKDLRKISVRGLEVIECVEPVMITFEDPRDMLIDPLKERGLNIPFMVREFLWYMSGDDLVLPLCYYNPKMIEWSDDGVHLYGAYGKFIKTQLPWIFDRLLDSTNTRQAVIQIFPPTPERSKDIPCTLNFQFFVRDGKLSLISEMRSQDLYMGFPYDVFSFSNLLLLVAAKLNFEVGSHHHIVHNLHLYTENYEKAKKVFELNCHEEVFRPLNDAKFNHVDFDFIQEISRYEFFWKINIEMLRTCYDPILSLKIISDVTCIDKVSSYLRRMFMVLLLQIVKRIGDDVHDAKVCESLVRLYPEVLLNTSSVFYPFFTRRLKKVL